MKHLLLSFTLFISLSAFSQISVISTDMMQLGDTVTRYVDTMTTQVAGPAGANQNWVMTTATAHQTLDTRAILPSATPFASSFTSSNLAMTNDDLSYLFFDQNSTSSVVKGAAGDLLMTGCNINSPFVPDMLLHNFPRTYGDHFVDDYAMDVTINGSCINQALVDKVRLKHISTIYDTTDGYGTITTPVGTYECLRVKKVDFSIDSTWVKPLYPPNWSLFSTKIDTSYSYSWITKEGKLAIAELANDSLDNPKKFTWSQIPPPLTGITSLNIEMGIFAFPNPAQEKIVFSGVSENSILDIYDATGGIVQNKMIQRNYSFTDVSRWKNGMYFFQVKSTEGILIGKGKFAVQR